MTDVAEVCSTVRCLIKRYAARLGLLISQSNCFEHQWLNYVAWPACIWSLNALPSTFNLKKMKMLTLLGFSLDLTVLTFRGLSECFQLCVYLYSPYHTITFHTVPFVLCIYISNALFYSSLISLLLPAGFLKSNLVIWY